MKPGQSPAAYAHMRAWQKKYDARPENIKKRAQRNAARREYEKIFGDQPRSVEIDHKRMVKDGGSNAVSNLRAVSAKENRGWRRGRSGY